MPSPITIRAAGRSLAAALLLASMPVQAQEHDPQFWSTLGASIPLGESASLDLEWVMRFGDDAGGLYEMELGGMVGVEVSDNLALSGGYARVPSYPASGGHRIEDRLRQQIAFSDGPLGGRVRLEERFRSDGDDIGLRLRPQIAWSLPLDARKTTLRLSHESFIALNSTDWGQNSGYERMRNAAGLRRPLGAGLTGEIGYLNQYSFSRGGPDQMAHVLTLGLSLGL